MRAWYWVAMVAAGALMWAGLFSIVRAVFP